MVSWGAVIVFPGFQDNASDWYSTEDDSALDSWLYDWLLAWCWCDRKGNELKSHLHQHHHNILQTSVNLSPRKWHPDYRLLANKPRSKNASSKRESYWKSCHPMPPWPFPPAVQQSPTNIRQQHFQGFSVIFSFIGVSCGYCNHSIGNTIKSVMDGICWVSLVFNWSS